MGSFKIIADPLIADAERLFREFGSITLMAGREIRRHHLRDADVLLVRSVTPVGEELLDGTPVKFVGSATSGIDHVDAGYLAQRGIGFAYAPGSNARAVTEYVLAAVCALVADMGLARADWTVGVIGYGHVGADVAALFEALGARCLVNDPPRAALFGDREYVSLQQALRADVVTLHTPLTDSGPHSTRHLIKAEQLARLRAGAVLINAARGGVIDETALLDTLAARDDLRVALDCWCNEPAIDLRLLERVAIATPHIAGHTAQAKQRGTQALYEAFRRFVAGGARDQEIAERRAGGTPPLGRSFSPSSVISHFDIRAETARLRAMARTDDIATHFDRCRAAHLRHEFLPISDQPAALSYTGALAGDS